MRAITLIPPLLVLAACAPAPEAPPNCHIGALTPEGATCQTLRDAKDRLYSFYADMTGHKIGDQVCVCGAESVMSRCATGIALDIDHLGHTCPTD